jgi:hypothetical protein
VWHGVRHERNCPPLPGSTFILPCKGSLTRKVSFTFLCGMKRVSSKKYVIAFSLYLVAVVLHVAAGESALAWQFISSIILFLAIANFGYQLFKYYDAHDEFEQRNLMKGVCLGALVTGILCLFYSFLESVFPVFQAEWAFFMLVGFSTIGQVLFTHKSS